MRQIQSAFTPYYIIDYVMNSDLSLKINSLEQIIKWCMIRKRIWVGYYMKAGKQYSVCCRIIDLNNSEIYLIHIHEHNRLAYAVIIGIRHRPHLISLKVH